MVAEAVLRKLEPYEQRPATRAEVTGEAAEVVNGPGLHRARTAFWCEGHLGDWNGLCGHHVLAGECYVQSGEHRLCLACAEIEAKQITAVDKAFARAIFLGVMDAFAEPVRGGCNLETPACLSSTEEQSIEKKGEEPNDRWATMSAAQALLSENEQLAKLARSQQTVTRIREDERRHRERIVSKSCRPELLLADEAIDENVALLIEGISKEVAVMGVLCDTLRDRLESIFRDLGPHG